MYRMLCDKKGFIVRKGLCTLSVITLLTTTLVGCSNQEAKKDQSPSTDKVVAASLLETTAESMPKISWPDTYTVGSAVSDTVDCKIELEDTSVTINGTGATVNGTVVTITAAGTYEISGMLTDGQLIIDTQDDETVKIILNGAQIKNTTSCAINVVSAPKKVTLHIQKDSVNLIEDGTEERDENAAIYAKDDLKISGEGELYIIGNYKKGISCKDDLEIKNASIYVNAADDGIRGKDSLTIEDAYLYVIAKADGLRTSNEDEGKGQMSISNSELYITSEQDAIQSVAELTLTDNTGVLCAGGGSPEVIEQHSDEFGGRFAQGLDFNENHPDGGRPDGERPEDIGDKQGGRPDGERPEDIGDKQGERPDGERPEDIGDKQGERPDGERPDKTDSKDKNSSTDAEEDTASTKGIKAGKEIVLDGGSYVIDSYDDAIHSNVTITVVSGEYVISTGDDGIHADDTLTVEGGNISITKCYEGLEAGTIYYKDGTCRIVSTDDGVNGATDNGDAVKDAIIEISGGYLMVNADGDGIDSNGSIGITGGTVLVYGPTSNGNGALDYDTTLSVSEDATLLAVGSCGMVQGVSESEYGALAFTCSVDADTIMSIQDTEGTILFTFAAPKQYESVIFTSPQLTKGSDYTIYTDGTYSVEAADGVFAGGSYSGGKELGTIEAK